MFAGVGGFRAGLNLAGGFQCIGHCEIDKYADASYRAIHAPGKEEVYYTHSTSRMQQEAARTVGKVMPKMLER